MYGGGLVSRNRVYRMSQMKALQFICFYIFRRRLLYLDPLASSRLYVETHDGVGLGKEICVPQVVAGDVQLHS